MATLTSLQTALQTKLGIPSTDSLITTTVQTAVLNEAINKLEGEGIWQWAEATETLNAAAGNATLTPSSTNYSRTISLTIPGGDPLELKPVAWLDKLASASGPPVFYGFFAGQILIRPKADASYAFTHRYLKREIALSSGSDAPLAPDRWVPAILEYAAYLCYRRMNDQDNAKFCLEAYGRWIAAAQANGDLKAYSYGGGKAMDPQDDPT